MNNRDTTDRSGIYKCGATFEKIGFIFREQTICDYGIDAIIERKDEKYPSGKLIAVQIKSGDSYFKERKDDKVVFRGENKHYDYWLNHSLPVIIVLYSPSNDKLNMPVSLVVIVVPLFKTIALLVFGLSEYL